MHELIKDKLQNLQTRTNLEKAKIENSPTVNRFVDLLIKNSTGWLLVRKWLQQEERTPLLLVNGDFNIKNMRENLFTLINTHYLRRIAFDFLYWINELDENQANQMNSFLLELLHNELLMPKKEIFRYCPSCSSTSLTLMKDLDQFVNDTCENCRGIRLRQILSSTLNDEIKRSIWNGQLLEIYTKKILEKEGVEFIGGHANGYECFTSIRYTTSVGEGEIDCLGTVGNTIIFVETKMTTLNSTDFKKQNGIFDDVFGKLKVRNLNKLKVFVAFGIDKNVDASAYHDCCFLDIYEKGNIAETVLEKVLRIGSQETINGYLRS